MEATLFEYFATQGPFAILFVWLFYTSRKESQDRELRLYKTLEDQTDILRTFSEKYDIVIDKLDEIEERLPKG